RANRNELSAVIKLKLGCSRKIHLGRDADFVQEAAIEVSAEFPLLDSAAQRKNGIGQLGRVRHFGPDGAPQFFWPGEAALGVALQYERSRFGDTVDMCHRRVVTHTLA